MVLKIISKWGYRSHDRTRSLKLDLIFDETAGNSMLPWLRLSYLSKAARWGNPDTFSCLLLQGPAQLGLLYISRDILILCGHVKARLQGRR
jgi:hypothetical protein